MSFVGFGALEVSSGGTSTPLVPTGVQAGDLLVLVAAHRYFGGFPPTFGTPTALDGNPWIVGGTETADIYNLAGQWRSVFAWWYQVAVSDVSSDPVTLTDGNVSAGAAAIGAIRGAAVGEDLSTYDFHFYTAAPTLILTGDPLQPQATQATANGLMLGVGHASNQAGSKTLNSNPIGWTPNAGLGALQTEPVALWASAVLTDGPLALADAPITLQASGNLRQFSWLTFWIDAAPEVVPPTPTGNCLVLDAADLIYTPGEGMGFGPSDATGSCSTDVLGMFTFPPHSASWEFTLDADQAAALNGIGGFWLRALLLWGEGGELTVDPEQITLALNAEVPVDIGDEFHRTSGPAPEADAWCAADLFSAWGDSSFIVGVNTVTVTLVTRFNSLAQASISTLQLDQIGFGSDGDQVGNITFDACGCMSCVAESEIDHIVTIRDFPTGIGGTISGRPNLLCATYGVMIIDRTNRATVVRMPDSGWDLKFNRRLDRTSNAELTVYLGQGPGDRSGVGAECCADLSRVGEWMHELVIWREDNPIEQWGGPVTSVEDSPGLGVWTCKAHDRSIWWDERALPYDLIYTGARKQDAARVFTDLLRAAEQPRSHNGVVNSGGQLLPYDPIGLEAFAYPTGVMVDQKVLLKADDVIIGTELRSLGDSVLDWTVVGRRVYVGALVLNLEPIPILTQDHWLEQNPKIVRNGIGVAEKVVVRGSGDVRGEYPPGQVVTPRWSQYGSHFKLLRDSTITDNEVATERARSYWERWQQPNFTVLSNEGTLGPKAPVTVEDLIPGRAVQIAILSGCMPTSLRLGERRTGAGRQFFAYDSGQVAPLIVPQRLFEVTVEVSDSVESSVKIDTQALGTDERTRGRINWPSVGGGG
jgi:hypothetical protein